MKKLIFIIILILLISPISALATVNPGYGVDLTCTTSNYSGYNCNDKTDMFKRIAELEKRVNELESRECPIVGASGTDRTAGLEIRIERVEDALTTLQNSIFNSLKGIIMLLISK